MQNSSSVNSVSGAVPTIAGCMKCTCPVFAYGASSSSDTGLSCVCGHDRNEHHSFFTLGQSVIMVDGNLLPAAQPSMAYAPPPPYYWSAPPAPSVPSQTRPSANKRNAGSALGGSSAFAGRNVTPRTGSVANSLATEWPTDASTAPIAQGDVAATHPIGTMDTASEAGEMGGTSNAVVLPALRESPTTTSTSTAGTLMLSSATTATASARVRAPHTATTSASAIPPGSVPADLITSLAPFEYSAGFSAPATNITHAQQIQAALAHSFPHTNRLNMQPAGRVGNGGRTKLLQKVFLFKPHERTVPKKGSNRWVEMESSKPTRVLERKRMDPGENVHSFLVRMFKCLATAPYEFMKKVRRGANIAPAASGAGREDGEDSDDSDSSSGNKGAYHLVPSGLYNNANVPTQQQAIEACNETLSHACIYVRLLPIDLMDGDDGSLPVLAHPSVATSIASSAPQPVAEQLPVGGAAVTVGAGQPEEPISGVALLEEGSLSPAWQGTMDFLERIELGLEPDAPPVQQPVQQPVQHPVQHPVQQPVQQPVQPQEEQSQLPVPPRIYQLRQRGIPDSVSEVPVRITVVQNEKVLPRMMDAVHSMNSLAYFASPGKIKLLEKAGDTIPVSVDVGGVLRNTLTCAAEEMVAARLAGKEMFVLMGNRYLPAPDPFVQRKAAWWEEVGKLLLWMLLQDFFPHQLDTVLVKAVLNIPVSHEDVRGWTVWLDGLLDASELQEDLDQTKTTLIEALSGYDCEALPHLIEAHLDAPPVQPDGGPEDAARQEMVAFQQRQVRFLKDLLVQEAATAGRHASLEAIARGFQFGNVMARSEMGGQRVLEYIRYWFQAPVSTAADILDHLVLDPELEGRPPCLDIFEEVVRDALQGEQYAYLMQFITGARTKTPKKIQVDITIEHMVITSRTCFPSLMLSTTRYTPDEQGKQYMLDDLLQAIAKEAVQQMHKA